MAFSMLATYKRWQGEEEGGRERERDTARERCYE
jgi:hypothetical protein